MGRRSEVWKLVDDRSPIFAALSDRVWDTPETNYEEVRSSAAHLEMLEAEGFRVHHNIAGIPTAVMGEAEQRGPVIAILGEYDALPGLSQEAYAASAGACILIT